MFNLFTPKVETVGTVSDFLAQGRRVREVDQTATITASMMALAPLTFATTASASAITDRVIVGLNPLIELVQAFAYPISFLMMSAGCLVIMVGNRSRGVGLIKWAAIGFIGMQLIPGVMQILMDVGAAIKQ